MHAYESGLGGLVLEGGQGWVRAWRDRARGWCACPTHVMAVHHLGCIVIYIYIYIY